MTRPRRTPLAAGAAVLGVLAVAAVVGLLDDKAPGRPTSGHSTETSAPRGEPIAEIPDVPPVVDEKLMGPPIVLQLDGESVPLTPWTSCYRSGCYDGLPKPPFHDVGERTTVPFSFPDEGWSFEATFEPAGSKPGACRRVVTVPVRKLGRYTFEIPAAGAPGSYDVQLFGRGPTGDAVTTFHWTTTIQGMVPEPRAMAGVLVDDDGEVTSWGVTISLRDVAGLTQTATATVTVTAADGASVRLGPYREPVRCPESGTLYLSGPEEDGLRAADLGPGPWTYRVVVALGDHRYTGIGSWPDDREPDLLDDDSTQVPLIFDPPLPAFTG